MRFRIFLYTNFQAYEVLKRISIWINRSKSSSNDSTSLEKEIVSKCGILKNQTEDLTVVEEGKKRASGGFETARRLKLRRIIEENNEADVLENVLGLKIFGFYLGISW